MVIYKCDCSMCIKETNEKYIIWNRVLTISDKNIKWKRSSWFCMRGYNGTENTYMKYIWGSIYKKETVGKTKLIVKDIPYYYLIFFRILLLFER